jgi:N-carbamoylputrescine amidase
MPTHDQHRAHGAPVRVASIQMEPRIGKPTENLAASLRLCAEAVDHGAELLVLPELCSSGYMFESRQEARAAAEQLPDGPACSEWTAFCRARGVHLVAGIAERDDDRLFNSCVVLGPEGYVGTYRKVHLWNRENLFFEPGDLGFPVFDTQLGRVAAFICYDGWFPEAYRACVLQGADIICIPTNWVPVPGQVDGSPAMATILVQANAHTNSVPVVAADRIGIERGQPFNGQSVIVSHTGWPVAGPASVDRQEILYADLDLGAARLARTWNDFNDPIRDRRPNAYDRYTTAPGAADARHQ